MKNKIVSLSLILSAFMPLVAFSADDVTKHRKQGTALIEQEHAQQAEILTAPTSNRGITTDDISSSGVTKGSSSMNASSKLVASEDVNKLKRRLRFNPPQE
jgi:hypothetical protein